VKSSAKHAQAAFSLVEVATAMTLLVICFGGLLFLLSSGIDTTRNTAASAEAVRLLKQLSTGVQGAAFDAGTGQYRMVGLGDIARIRWEANGVANPPVQLWISNAGTPVEDPAAAAYVCRVSITPPDAANPASYGFAHWQIAWPATAEWSAKRWLRTQGHDELIVMFRAR
jgi:uncharacterized protein (TIGR02598 family)